MATPKITKPTVSILSPLPLLSGRFLSRIGRKRIVTAGIRNRNCQLMVLRKPAANTPIEADSW